MWEQEEQSDNDIWEFYDCVMEKWQLLEALICKKVTGWYLECFILNTLYYLYTPYWNSLDSPHTVNIYKIIEF